MYNELSKRGLITMKRLVIILALCVPMLYPSFAGAETSSPIVTHEVCTGEVCEVVEEWTTDEEWTTETTTETTTVEPLPEVAPVVTVGHHVKRPKHTPRHHHHRKARR
jgi:hypothetical protein